MAENIIPQSLTLLHLNDLFAIIFAKRLQGLILFFHFVCAVNAYIQGDLVKSIYKP